MSKKKFSIFRPRLPRVSGVGDTAASSARWAKQTFARSGAKCPTEGCEGSLEVLDIVDEESANYTATTSLACELCGEHEPIEHLIDQAVEKIDEIRSGERIFFVSGLLIFTAFAFISFLNGNFLTLFGGAVFSIILIMRGFLFRYKAWQITNRKLFSAAPPVREWLADEFKRSRPSE